MKITGLVPMKLDPAKSNRWKSIEQLFDLCDTVIVLNDGSPTDSDMATVLPDFLPLKPLECLDLSRWCHDHSWNDYSLRMTLLARALAHDATFVLWLDDDELLHNVTRQKLESQIQKALNTDCVAISYPKREMWNQTQFRVDAIWGRKRKMVLQKNPLLERSVQWQENHLQRLQIGVNIGNNRVSHFTLRQRTISKPRSSPVASFQAAASFVMNGPTSES